MAAKRVPSIMPSPTRDEPLEILSIHSAAGRMISREMSWDAPPFRSPYHTVSDVTLLEEQRFRASAKFPSRTTACWFLDELPAFKHSALEVLRRPWRTVSYPP